MFHRSNAKKFFDPLNPLTANDEYTRHCDSRPRLPDNFRKTTQSTTETCFSFKMTCGAMGFCVNYSFA